MKLDDGDYEAIAKKTIEIARAEIKEEVGGFIIGWLVKLLMGAALGLIAWQTGRNL